MASTTYVFRWNSSGDAQGWSGSLGANVTGGQNGIESSGNDEQGTGSLQTSLAVKNNNRAGNVWTWSGTWEDLGVPAGSTIIAVTANYDWRCAAYTAGTGTNRVGPFILTNAADAVRITFSAAQSSVTSTTNWATVSGSTLSGQSDASNTSIKLKHTIDLRTANTDGAVVTMRVDYLAVTITYNPPAEPLTGWADDFNRANATTLGEPYSDPTAAWGISSNQAYIHTDRSTRMAFYLDIEDGDIDVRCSVTPGQTCGLIVRSNGTTYENEIVVDLNGAGNYIGIAKFNNWSWSWVDGASVTWTPGDTMRVRCEGSSVKLFQNDTELLDLTLSDHQAQTRIGFYVDSGAGATSVRIDDFVAQSVGDITGTAAVAVQPGAVAAAGTLTFSGATAATSQPGATAAQGTLTFAGAGSVAAQPGAVAATGALTFTGAVAIAARPGAIAAQGAQAFAGTVEVAAPAAQVTAGGALEFTGTIAVTAPAAQIAAEGDVEILSYTGTIAVTAPAAQIAAGGTYTPQAITGTAEVAAPAPGIAATGTLTFAGTIGLATLVPQIDADGALTFAGTIEVAALPTAIAVGGAQAFTGAVAIGAQPGIVDADGALSFGGTLAVTVPPAAVDAQGEVEVLAFEGVVTIVAPAAQIAAIGTHTPQAITGTVAIAAIPGAIAAAAVLSFSGAIAVEAQPGEIVGTAVLGMWGAAAITAIPGQIDASGTYTPAAVAGMVALAAMMARIAATGELSGIVEPLPVTLPGTTRHSATVPGAMHGTRTLAGMMHGTTTLAGVVRGPTTLPGVTRTVVLEGETR